MANMTDKPLPEVCPTCDTVGNCPDCNPVPEPSQRDKPLPDLLAEIEELDQKATPGPWRVIGAVERAFVVTAPLCQVYSMRPIGDEVDETRRRWDADARVIAGLRNAWPRLRDEIERLTAWADEAVRNCAKRNCAGRDAERDALKAENERLRQTNVRLQEYLVADPSTQVEAIEALKAENEALREVVRDVEAAISLSGNRWDEWGERALSVAEALDAALEAAKDVK